MRKFNIGKGNIIITRIPTTSQIKLTQRREIKKCYKVSHFAIIFVSLLAIFPPPAITMENEKKNDEGE